MRCDGVAPVIQEQQQPPPPQQQQQQQQPQQQQCCVFFITGANSGVGLEATRHLAERLVILHNGNTNENAITATSSTTRATGDDIYDAKKIKTAISSDDSTTSSNTSTSTGITPTPTPASPVIVRNTIYLLCRSEAKANEAIADVWCSIGLNKKKEEGTAEANDNNNNNNTTTHRRHRHRHRHHHHPFLSLQYIKFDAYDDRTTIEKNIRRSLAASEDEIVIGGIVLNAGGFGDDDSSGTTTTTNSSSSSSSSKTISDRNTDRCDQPRPACDVAQLNIIGHVNLVNYLLSTYKTTTAAAAAATATIGPPTSITTTTTPITTRIVAVGSEASFASPGITMDYHTANFVEHLLGTVPLKDRSCGINYGWIKGILALYWAAFARRQQHPPHPHSHPHPEDDDDTLLYVVTVSPGAVANTELFLHANVSPFLRGMARLSQCFGGSHTAAEGAKRYIDAVLPSQRTNNDDPPPRSGSFLASRKGFIHDYGNVANHKNGKFMTDIELQDKAWDAVNQFLDL